MLARGHAVCIARKHLNLNLNPKSKTPTFEAHLQEARHQVPVQPVLARGHAVSVSGRQQVVPAGLRRLPEHEPLDACTRLLVRAGIPGRACMFYAAQSLTAQQQRVRRLAQVATENKRAIRRTRTWRAAATATSISFANTAVGWKPRAPARRPSSARSTSSAHASSLVRRRMALFPWDQLRKTIWFCT